MSDNSTCEADLIEASQVRTGLFPLRRSLVHQNSETTSKSVTGEFLRFAIASAVSFGTVLGGSTLLTYACGLDSAVAYGFALCVASLINFAVCRWFVFQKNDGAVAADFVRFVSSIAGWRCVEFLAFLVLNKLAGIGSPIVVVVVNGLSTIGKFFWARLVVFGRPELASDLWQPQPLAANDER